MKIKGVRLNGVAYDIDLTGTVLYNEVQDLTEEEKSVARGNIDVPSALSDLETDEDHRLVTDEQISSWNGKAEPEDIPSSLSQLTQDSTHRTVTSQQIIDWDNKSEYYGKYYTDLTKIDKYLYMVEYDRLDYDFAYRYFEDRERNVPVPACSAVRKGTSTEETLTGYTAML